jgi:hypothetical protein
MHKKLVLAAVTSALAIGAGVAPAGAHRFGHPIPHPDAILVCFITHTCPAPPNAAACKDGGWQNYSEFGFQPMTSEADCLSYAHSKGHSH